MQSLRAFRQYRLGFFKDPLKKGLVFGITMDKRHRGILVLCFDSTPAGAVPGPRLRP